MAFQSSALAKVNEVRSSHVGDVCPAQDKNVRLSTITLVKVENRDTLLFKSLCSKIHPPLGYDFMKSLTLSVGIYSCLKE